MRITQLSASLALALVLLTGCATYYDHRFAPAPIEVELFVGERQPEAQARALVTVLGIRRPADGRGALVEARLRIENIGSTPVALVPDTLSLVAADLRELGTPSVAPWPEPIAQGSSGLYDIDFELKAGRTPGDYDLQGLNLKFEVDFGDQRVQTGITFERTSLAYPSDPRVSFGFGYYR